MAINQSKIGQDLHLYEAERLSELFSMSGCHKNK